MTEAAEVLEKLVDWVWILVSALAVLAYKTTNKRIDKHDEAFHDQDQKIVEMQRRIEREEHRSDESFRRLYEKIEANRLETKGDFADLRAFIEKRLEQMSR